MAIDLTNIAFASKENYLKRDSTIAVTKTTGAVGSGTEVLSFEYTHGLGYVPFVAIGLTVEDDDIIWSGGRVDTTTGSTLFGFDEERSLYYVDDQKVYAKIFVFDSFRDRTVYFLTYLDYND